MAAPARTATVLLTGRECPWRCAMCDLWRYTTTQPTRRAAPSPRRSRRRARNCEPASEDVTQLKLYNAGSFFDPRAVPEPDYEDMAAALAGLAQVIVESHPSLIGPRVDRFLDALQRQTSRRLQPSGSRSRWASRPRTARPSSAEQADDGRGLRARRHDAARTGSVAPRLPAHLAAVCPAGRAGLTGSCGRSTWRSLPAPRSCRSFPPGRATARWRPWRRTARSSRRGSKTSSAASKPPWSARIADGSSSTSGISGGSPAATHASTSGARACTAINLEQQVPPSSPCRACGFGASS